MEFRQKSHAPSTTVFLEVLVKELEDISKMFTDKTVMIENYISYVILLKQTSHIDSSFLTLKRTDIFKI